MRLTFPLPVIHLASLLRYVGGQHTGLLVVGGTSVGPSAEVWWPDQETNCSLPETPIFMSGPTVDIWQDTIILCYWTSCYHLSQESWEEWSSSQFERKYHTSAVTSEGLLLLGGDYSLTDTELLTEGQWSDGGFHLNPGRTGACSIQVESSTIVLTGGMYHEFSVKEYSNLTGQVEATKLHSTRIGRWQHACGSYLDDQRGETERVLIVTGGYYDYKGEASTEVFNYPTGEAWRVVGSLPSPMYGLRGASLSNIFHVLCAHLPI